VTRLPHVFVARYCGESIADARMHLATIWQMLRPALLGRAAVMPRIWST
jgi:urease accessory protein